MASKIEFGDKKSAFAHVFRADEGTREFALPACWVEMYRAGRWVDSRLCTRRDAIRRAKLFTAGHEAEARR